MSVRELTRCPEPLSHFPDGYRWLELHDRGDVYGHAAIAERGDFLELHVTMREWGPQTVRNVRGDVEWVKDEARRLGHRRIVGIRADSKGNFNPNLFRFASMFGFVEQTVFQLAAMDIGDEEYSQSQVGNTALR